MELGDLGTRRRLRRARVAADDVALGGVHDDAQPVAVHPLRLAGRDEPCPQVMPAAIAVSPSAAQRPRAVLEHPPRIARRDRSQRPRRHDQVIRPGRTPVHALAVRQLPHPRGSSRASGCTGTRRVTSVFVRPVSWLVATRSRPSGSRSGVPRRTCGALDAFTVSGSVTD